jgi:Flp pilus assembly protein TadD
MMIAIAVLLAIGDGGPSLPLAEMTADRCLYGEALRMLDEVPAFEQHTRAAQMLRARLLVQLERGRQAVAILTSLSSGSGREEADRLMLLGLAFSAANDLPAAEKTLRQAQQQGADEDLVEASIGMLRIQARRLPEAELILRAVLKRDPLLSGALYNLACVRALTGDVAEAAALIRMSWHAGFKDPDQLRSDPMLGPVRARRGLIDDLIASHVRHCGTY